MLHFCMIVVAEYTPTEVFPFVPENCRYKVKESFAGYDVKMSSSRLVLFKTNRFCVCCGIEGNKLLLEKSNPNVNPHFNMYAYVNGDMILMTKDHIIPKSMGGKDHISNYQTMCQVCNQIKSDYNISLEDLKKVRQSFDNYMKTGMSRNAAWKSALKLKDKL